MERPERATKSVKKNRNDNVIGVITALDDKVRDAKAMIDLAVEADDATPYWQTYKRNSMRAEAKVADLEFKRMFSGEMDGNNCYADIQSGSGGTEAQDWAEMSATDVFALV